jgi:peptide-methionine (R)-S-oxide reductase
VRHIVLTPLIDLCRENIPSDLRGMEVSEGDSIANLPRQKKYPLYEAISAENLENYHKISCYPISQVAEDDMELISDLITWGERYLHHWSCGSYCCSRCLNPVYSSQDKWKGPCVWPSFRKAIHEDSVHTRVVQNYNAYTCTVKEVYCGKCRLFLGHQFEDAITKGDTHQDAHWRH